MAMGQIRVRYKKYLPTTVPTGISHTHPQLYSRVKNCTRTRRVSGTCGYIYILYLKTILKISKKNIIITSKISRKLIRTGNTSNKSS
jgi:hypothetical protein